MKKKISSETECSLKIRTVVIITLLNLMQPTGGTENNIYIYQGNIESTYIERNLITG